MSNPPATDESTPEVPDHLKLEPASGGGDEHKDVAELLSHFMRGSEHSERLSGEKLAGFVDFLRSSGWTEDAYRTTVDGDFVHGDKHIHTRTHDQIVLSYLSDERVRDSEYHVPPPNMARLREALAENRVLVLNGRQGWGKTCTGVRLLQDLGHLGIMGVDERTDLSRITGEHIENGSGLIVSNMTTAQLRKISETQLAHIVHTLRECGARMVITGELSPGSGVPVLRRLMVEAGPEAARRDILRSHLTRIAGPERADEISATEIVRNRFSGDEPLSADTTVEWAERLAATESTDDPAERDHRERRAEFESWIGRLTLAQWPWLLVCTLHDTRPWQDALASADALFQRLDMSDKRRQQRGLMALDEYVTHTTRGYGSQVGVVSTETVTLSRPKLRAWIIDHLWSLAGPYRLEIMDWLYMLGFHEDDEVRRSAAAAVGQLFNRDFRVIVNTIVEKWAARERLDTAEAAAFALAVAADNPRLLTPATRLVQRWAEGSASQQLVAATALGAVLGPRSPGLTLVTLDRLMHRASVRLMYRVARSLTELVNDSLETFSDPVLELLCRWRRSSDRSKRQGSVASFLELAQDHVSATGGPSELPVLLSLSLRQARHDELIAELWRGALQDSLLYVLARDVLAWWAECCEDAPEATAVLGRLLVRVTAEDERAEFIVLRATESWKNAHKLHYAPTTADVVRAHVTDRQRTERRDECRN